MKDIYAVDFDSFSYCCPFFDGEDESNNGYGCKSEEDGDGNKDESGVWHRACFSADCPVCSNIYPEDIDRDDIEWDGCNPDPEDSSLEFGESGICIVHLGPDSLPEAREAWLDYQRYMNRYDKDWKPMLPAPGEVS